VPKRFRVIHPFHPWFGREFELFDYRHSWSEDRVYYLDEKGDLGRIPTRYTDLRAEDPFVVMAAGRCHFRCEDLLELSRLLARLDKERSSNV